MNDWDTSWNARLMMYSSLKSLYKNGSNVFLVQGTRSGKKRRLDPVIASKSSHSKDIHARLLQPVWFLEPGQSNKTNVCSPSYK